MKSVSFRNFILGVTVVCLNCALAACSGANPSSEVIGTYSNPSGSFALDVRSGGTAIYTSVGATFPCTYTIAGDKLTLSCQGQSAKTVFTIKPDGSLTAQDGIVPALRKTK